MMGWGDGWGMAAWGWFALMHLVWWVLIISGIVVLVRWTVGSGRRRDQVQEDRALQIIRERYARGEIEKEEFEERRQALKGHDPGPASLPRSD
jgi:putative membrane protein